MGKIALTDQKIFVGGYNITGSTNSIALNYAAEAKDCTVYGNDTRINKGALKTVQVQASGFYDAVPQDSPLFGVIGVSDTPISIFAEATADGSVGYFFKAVAGEYSIGETVGEILKYSLGAGASDTLIKSQVLNDSTETATSNSGGLQLGAVSAAQSLYAVMHVTASGGTGDQTLDVTIASDDNGSFTSEITRLTFTQVTTSVTSQIVSLAGALTDDYFRAVMTITGTGSPTFDIALMIGVQ